MSKVAKKTDPKLWDEVKAEVTSSDKGGKPGQWSARKAQLASAEYKKEGGGYAGPKGDDNHLQQWTDESWGTKSGEKSAETGERYLPKSARESLTDEEYRRTSAKKRADTRKGKQRADTKAGKQFSSQPADVARKTNAPEHHSGDLASLDRKTLLERAAARGVKGRSRMKKAELVRALA